jgi:leader peptidase (prepilin peptidase)/N-methyltransferase
MLATPYLQIVAGLVGLLVGSLIAFLAPRLVAYRLEQPPPPPGPTLLVPLLGARFVASDRVRPVALEVAAAGVFAALAAHFGDRRQLLLAGLYSAVLLAIGYVDIQHRLVLNRLSYPGVVLGVAGAALWPGLSIPDALLGAAVGLLLFGALLIIGRGALGVGDVKLAIVIGAMRGYPGVFTALLLGVLLGGAAALFFLLVLRRGRKEYLAYAPYLAAGGILSFLVPSP